MVSIKNPSFKVAFKKNIPAIFGGDKYFDKIFQQIDDLTSPHKAWSAFCQQFVNDIFNNHKKEPQWTGIPHLNPVDCPCYPGSVILSQRRSLKNWVLRRKPNAFIAGPITDFYPSEKLDDMELSLPKHIEIQSKNGRMRRIYQSKNTETAVQITCVLEDSRRLDTENMSPDNTFIDLDNFEFTGFESDYCYLVTQVVTVESLKVDVTEDGSLFYEHTFSGSVPICFQTMKINIVAEGKGMISRLRHVNEILSVKLRSRRLVQNFLNIYTPNQCKFGNAVGDYPAVIRLQQPPAIQSYRRNFFHRRERHSLHPGIIIYVNNEVELRRLRTLSENELRTYVSAEVNAVDTVEHACQTEERARNNESADETEERTEETVAL